MNVDYLIQLLGNRLNALATAKEQAFLMGDLEQINKLDIEANEVLGTLNKLKLLQGISETAASTPFTEAQVVQNGIEASFGVNSARVIYNGDMTGCLLGYDISTYATDPLHEEKIADILNYIGDMDTIEKIDAYIETESISSPVSGYMVYNSSLKYNVDSRLMMAIMELDSRFGTAGIAIKTLNPGNIGNNDAGEIRTYNSWDEGVEAVAKWLDKHRVVEAPALLDEENLNKNETIETVTEIDENGNTITTTTTTTEEIIPVDEEVIESGDVPVGIDMETSTTTPAVTGMLKKKSKTA